MFRVLGFEFNVYHSMRNIFTIGETVFDILIKEGEVIAAKSGGAMLNTSVSLGRMNLPVQLITEIGDDEIGRLITNFLSNNNVEINYLNKGNTQTSLAIAFLNEQNDASYSFYRASSEKRSDVTVPLIQPDTILLFGSSYAINKEVRPYLKKLLQLAKENKAIIIYDPNFRKAHLHELKTLMPLIEENLAFANIVRGSDEDFKNIAGVKKAEEAYKFVSRFGKSTLIFTSGGKSVKLLNAKIQLELKVKAVKTISTIGAGDGFNAGIIAALIIHNVGYEDIRKVDFKLWEKILGMGISFGSEVCKSYENYISNYFAKSYY